MNKYCKECSFLCTLQGALDSHAIVVNVKPPPVVLRGIESFLSRGEGRGRPRGWKVDGWVGLKITLAGMVIDSITNRCSRKVLSLLPPNSIFSGRRAVDWTRVSSGNQAYCGQ